MKPRPIERPLSGLLFLALSLLPCVLRASDAQSECGLCYAEIADGQRVVLPLESTEVQLDVQPGLMEAELIQTFTNRTDTALEATYLYPLPPDATVTSFELRFRDRIIGSVVREKRQARVEYEKAKSEGKKAALLEQRDPSLFSTAVANFLPGETVKVVLRFLRPLPLAENGAEMRFPMTTGVKYFPADTTPGEPGASAANPPKIAAAAATEHHYYSFDILVSGYPQAEIESASHAIRVDRVDADCARVALADEVTIPDRDFVLRIETDSGSAPAPTAVAQRVGGTDYGLLTVFPPTAPVAADRVRNGRDVVFLVDRSGSMGGTRLENAKLGLQGCLAMLEPRDRFQIVVFSSLHEFYKPGWSQADAASLAEANRYVESIVVDGGTEMQPALAAVLRFLGEQRGSNDQVVIFLTDGDVGNGGDLIKLIEAQRGAARLFTFGIGMAPNAFLIEKMAALGQGQSRFISDDDSIARELADLFATLDSPVLGNLQLTLLDANGTELPAQVLPRTVPDVFLNRPVQAVYSSTEDAVAVRLEGTADGQRIGFTMPLAGKSVRGAGIAKRFGQLLYESLATQRRKATTPAAIAEVDKEMLAVALQYELVTPQTSRVAIDRTVSRMRDAALKSQTVAQYGAADQTSSTVIEEDGEEIVVLSPFEVDAGEDTGYVATACLAGTRIRTELRGECSGPTVVAGNLIKDIGAVRLEDLLGTVTGPVETEASLPSGSVGGTIDWLPLAATLDPSMVDRFTVDDGALFVGDISLRRAAYQSYGRTEASLGDGGLQTQRVLGNFSDGDRWAVLGQLSHLRDENDRWSGYADGRVKVGAVELKGGGLWNRWDGYGRNAFGRLEASFGVTADFQVRLQGAWNSLVREDAAQFTLASESARYDGLGFLNLDLLTAPVSSIEERTIGADVGGTVQCGGRHGWAAGVQWLERTLDWVPSDTDRTFRQRTLRVTAEDRWSFGPRERFSVRVRTDWNRVAGTTDGNASAKLVGGAGVDASAKVTSCASLFAGVGRETAAGSLPSGVWVDEGVAAGAVGLPTQRRAVAQAGVRVSFFADRLTGLVSYFDERTDDAAYRDWAWEAAHPEGELTDSGRIDAIRYSVWPRWTRAGWRTEWNFQPLRNLTAVLKWYEDSRNDGPVQGGNRRGLFMTRYDFDGGMLKGVSIGGGFEYRNAVRFNDDRVLAGGIRWNLLLAYERRVFGPAPTEIRLTLRNLDGTSYQPTRFAADRGRQVLLSVSQEF